MKPPIVEEKVNAKADNANRRHTRLDTLFLSHDAGTGATPRSR